LGFDDEFGFLFVSERIHILDDLLIGLEENDYYKVEEYYGHHEGIAIPYHPSQIHLHSIGEVDGMHL